MLDQAFAAEVAELVNGVMISFSFATPSTLAITGPTERIVARRISDPAYFIARSKSPPTIAMIAFVVLGGWESHIKVEHMLLLDVVVGERAAVLELRAAKRDEALLVRGDALLVPDLALHHVDGVARIHLQDDGLARQGLDKDLHATAGLDKDVAL